MGKCNKKEFYKNIELIKKARKEERDASSKVGESNTVYNALKGSYQTNKIDSLVAKTKEMLLNCSSEFTAEDKAKFEEVK